VRVRVLVPVVAFAALAGCSSNPPAPIPSPPPGAVVVTAAQTRFLESRVEAPAGAAFTIYFENRDSADHNVHVWDAAGASVMAGQIFGGPAARTENVPALTAGTYRVTCDIHPEMTAELLVH